MASSQKNKMPHLKGCLIVLARLLLQAQPAKVASAAGLPHVIAWQGRAGRGAASVGARQGSSAGAAARRARHPSLHSQAPGMQTPGPATVDRQPPPPRLPARQPAHPPTLKVRPGAQHAQAQRLCTVQQFGQVGLALGVGGGCVAHQLGVVEAC